MEDISEDLSVLMLKELVEHLSGIQESPPEPVVSASCTAGDLTKKKTGFLADESCSAEQHWIHPRYGEVDDCPIISSYRSNNLSPVSSADVSNKPDFCDRSQRYSRRLCHGDHHDNPSPEKFLDRERSRSPSDRSSSQRRKRRSSNSSSGTPAKTLHTRDKSHSPCISKDEYRRRRSLMSSLGPSSSGHSSSNRRPEAPQVIDEDVLALLKRVDEVRNRVKAVQAEADLSTFATSSVYSASQGQKSHIVSAANPEIRPAKAIPPMAPTLISHASDGFGSSSADLSNYPVISTMTSSQRMPGNIVPVLSEMRVTGPVSSIDVQHGVPVESSSSSQDKAIPVNVCALMSDIAGVCYKSEDNPDAQVSALLLAAAPAANRKVYKFKDNTEITMEWTGSLAETIQRFTPGSDEGKFDYVGFFMECFDRMTSDILRTDLQHVVILLNEVLIKNHVVFNEPIYITKTKIWQCSILENTAKNVNSSDGYGLCANSAILNVLGVAFPEKVADLRHFARHQGFLGWKLGRKQYNSVYWDRKYDGVRVKLWTELNRVFFAESDRKTYWQTDGGQVVQKKLKKVAAVVFGNTNHMIFGGPVCVDVRIGFRNHNAGEMLFGTHLSAGSAYLTLLSSVFRVSLLIKFLDDLMLLLGAGSLKRRDYNQIVTDFYFDMIWARRDFLAEICRTYRNLDPSVVKLIGGFAEKECAVVLECLVADDVFYYHLLGWILGKKLRADSYEIKQFFKMWSVSCSRNNRSVNMCRTLSEGISEARVNSKKSWFIDLILKNFADLDIFTSKACQSSYACSMVDQLLSGRASDQELYSGLNDYAISMQNHISIDPYTPMCVQVMLSNDARPLVYENLTSITGLMLSQVRSMKRFEFIRTSSCRGPIVPKLIEIIHRCVVPSQFQAVLDVASRDILYVPAIEKQMMLDFSVVKREQWHVGFWQSLVQDAAVMPDLRCLLADVKAGLRKPQRQNQVFFIRLLHDLSS